jgi:2-dehydro-3-deoxygalactonokinase
MITVDWGTSNVRAYRMDAAGRCTARKTSSRGIASVAKGTYREALMTDVGDWIADGEHQVLLSGMVGSRAGWLEVPYVAAPADVNALAAGCLRVPDSDLDIMIVPGVSGIDARGVPEVMRGEETQIVGAQLAEGNGIELVALPGTHTKWVSLQGNAIASFATYMTGDVFSALRSNTILRGFPESPIHAGRGFDAGVEQSRHADALTHHIFGARTLFLTGKLQEDQVYAYLSGLLIGYEVRHAMQHGQQVHLIGEEHLCALYAHTIEEYGGQASVEASDAAMRGLVRIGRMLGW